MATQTYDPIASIILSADSSSITFSAIPQTYTDLVCVAVMRSNTGTPEFYGQVNADTGTNYSSTLLYGTGSSGLSSRYSSATQLRFNANNTLDATNYTNAVINFMNYSNSNIRKTTLTRNSEAQEATVLGVSLWRSTAAITSIKLFPSSNSFASGSTFNLFGIKAGNA
jgi:hypothetical protein